MTRAEAIGYLLGEYVVVHEGNEYEKELNEALDVAIKALQGDMYCPNCGVRLVPEDEYLEPKFYDEDDYWNGRVPTHGRLIDADALEKELSKRWDISDDQDFCNKEVWDALRNAPTVQAKGGDADMNEVKSPYMQQSPNRATHGRLIDADLLMKELSDIQPYNWTDSEAEIQEEADYSLFKSLINSAPTVQADRPHGEWVGLDECSVCGRQAFDFIEGCVEGVEHLPNFCPNCGADMRGGNNATD